VEISLILKVITANKGIEMQVKSTNVLRFKKILEKFLEI